VLASSFRQQILWIFNERVASPSDIAAELGETLNRVAHHIDVLLDADCIERVDQKLVGNRLQSFYKATARAYVGKLEWEKVPPTVQAGMRATLLANILEESAEVVGAEAYDARTAHMSWTPMILDEQAIEEISQVLDRTLGEVIAIQDSTKERLASSGSAGFPYTATIMGYPRLGEETRVGPPVNAEEMKNPPKPTRRKQ
jgi:predicted ArsR family transcriptional regulator